MTAQRGEEPFPWGWVGHRPSAREGPGGIPMIPIHIFYSVFDDQMVRGFVLGATAGRTTLNGEGLQHEVGHSPLLASTNSACVSYDPGFGFEAAHIVKDALRWMYGDKPEEIFDCLTVYSERGGQEPPVRRRGSVQVIIT